MGLCLRWASRSGKLASNNPLVKGTLLLFFSKLKLPLSVKVNGLWWETIIAAVSLYQTTFKAGCDVRKAYNVVKDIAGSQYQSYECVTWEQLKWNWILLDSPPWVDIVFISASHSSSGAQRLCVLKTYKSSKRFSNYCRHLFPAARLHL